VGGFADGDRTTGADPALAIGAIADDRSPLLGQTNLTGLTADLADDAFLSELLSVYVDGLVMDLLLPLPSGSAPGVEMPFLERLCIALDEEEFRCHQRYGE
jgi:hypothetical protein